METLRTRHSTGGAHCHAARMGRQHSLLSGSSQGSNEGQPLPRGQIAGGGSMKLVALQRAVVRAVMQPLTPAERMQRKAPGGGRMSAYAARYIKPNDRLTSFERLEIYSRQYWFRVLGSLAEDFPGLRAVLVARRFEAICKAYLTKCPSRSFTLRNLGAQLETWLRQNPGWLDDRRALALDMVRLEWADIEAFDGLAKPPLCSEDFEKLKLTNLKLGVQPYVQPFELRYLVDNLLLETIYVNAPP